MGKIFGVNQRITVSIPEELLREAERLGRQRRVTNRSALFAEALQSLVSRSRSEEIDAQLDSYYQSRTKADLAEEKRMVRALGRSRRRIPLDPE